MSSDRETHALDNVVKELLRRHMAAPVETLLTDLRDRRVLN